MRRRPLVILLCLFVVVVVAVVVASCHSAGGLSATCSINSDCDKPLICAFGHCHNACVESSDCPLGSICVLSGTNGVCELPSEDTCSATVPCPTPLLCATDSRCRTPCEMTNQCPKEQACILSPGEPVGACYDTTGVDGGLPDGAPNADGATDGSGDGAMRDGGGSDGTTKPDGTGGHDASVDTTPMVDACPNALTQVGGIAATAADPHVTSGLAVRSPTQLLIFSAYEGPALAGFDAGMAGDGGLVDLVEVQAFDPVSGGSLGPNIPAFSVPPLGGMRLVDASVSPNGKIALLFGYGTFYGYGATGTTASFLYAAFLSEDAADGGTPRITVEQTVELDSQGFYGQPHATWSPSASAFSLSWEEASSSDTISVRNFTTAGTGAGGGNSLVPTNSSQGVVAVGAFEQGSVGATGTGLTAVTFAVNGTGVPDLTFLNASGVEVGSPLSLIGQSSPWSTVAGTVNGFVTMMSPGGGSTAMVFVQTLPDGGLPMGDAGAAQAPVTLSGMPSLDGRAISDNAGGAGGVGAALFTRSGLSFVYVSADGTLVQEPTSVLTDTYSDEDLFALTNYAGSFSLSLYSNTTHATQAAATGCP